MGKPSETVSSDYFLEGPKELAQLALAPRHLTPLMSLPAAKTNRDGPEAHSSQ